MAHTFKEKVVTIRLTVEQFRLIDQRAKRCDLPLSTWIRAIAAHAATRQPDADGYIRIREPEGVTT